MKDKKKKLVSSEPSKAYLVSFGDTMTALLAFFIVINSLSQEQTGAAMYSGTGSFARAFSSSGSAGSNFGNRSKYVSQQNHPKPIYALAENLDQNEIQGKKGPDEDGDDRIMDRDSEQFQKFLGDLTRNEGLVAGQTRTDQTVIDSFSSMMREDGSLSVHAQELLTQACTRLRNPDSVVEVIFWARMPSPDAIKTRLEHSKKMKKVVTDSFWLPNNSRNRLVFRVKPWLFSDAKRPKYSVVLAKTK